MLYGLAFHYVNTYLLVQEITKPTLSLAQKDAIELINCTSCMQGSTEYTS